MQVLHLVNLHSLSWVYMLRLHELAGIVGTNRDSRKVKRAIFVANLLENATVPSVPNKIEPLLCAQHGPATPQGSPPVTPTACTPMLQAHGTVISELQGVSLIETDQQEARH